MDIVIEKVDYATVSLGISSFFHSKSRYTPCVRFNIVSLDHIKSILKIGRWWKFTYTKIHPCTAGSYVINQKRNAPPLKLWRSHHYDKQWTIEDWKKWKQPLLQLQGVFGTGPSQVSVNVNMFNYERKSEKHWSIATIYLKMWPTTLLND